MNRLRRRSRLQQGCPSRGLRRSADRLGVLCPLTRAPSHIRVETVEGIVGELSGIRGNKVFQVVTPVR